MLEAIVIDASDETEALAIARKAEKKSWAVLDDKRRKNYTAEEVSTKA